MATRGRLTVKGVADKLREYHGNQAAVEARVAALEAAPQPADLKPDVDALKVDVADLKAALGAEAV